MASPRPKLGLFHTTGFASLEDIAEKGLDPSAGGGLFRHGGYGHRSAGKVFLAEGRDAALGWYGKIEDMLADRVSDDHDAADVVPVLLQVTPQRGLKLHVDDVGAVDVLGAGSWYAEQAIPPRMISFWNPTIGDWNSIENWSTAEADDGVKEVEFFDENGDPTDEENAESAAFYTFGPYDSGGFKPDMNDEDAWDEDLT